jgi:4-alpha-glucanotransferase
VLVVVTRDIDWNEQEAILRDFSIGAPPDGFNPGGQNWGLVLELSARPRRQLACFGS